jgi:mRNA-degrading endonuclease YafQ of YafQ-DinJ toxin-antitoxin module
VKVEYTAKFGREWRKLPARVKTEAEKQEKIFRQNPKDHRLKTHKLKGRLDGLWSFSVTHRHRIMFEFISSKKVLFHDIGDHDVYR